MELANIIDLTPAQSIEILEKAKEILGPNGENWNKGCWFGLTREDISYVGDSGAWEDVHDLTSGDAGQANTWCILGAVEEAAYQLGITSQREASDRFAMPISLQNLVSSKKEWEHWSVIDVNDNSDSTFADIKGLIDERLAQLRA